MFEYVTTNPEDTIKIGKAFGGKLKKGDTIAFLGAMGMGKTTFIRGLVDGAGFLGNVSSPTFALVNEYPGDFSIFHFDMYRISSHDDLYSTGFYDYLDSGETLVIEWSEKIKDILPKNTVFVTMSGDLLKDINSETRTITIQGDDRFENLSY